MQRPDRSSSLSSFSRRKFIRFTATASLAAASTKLLGCVSQSPGTSGTSNRPLRILAWAGYDEPAVISKFEQQFGTKVEFKTYVGGEQMLQLFNQSPPGTFDALISDGEYVAKLAALNALDAIDPAQIPNLKDYYPTYQNFPGFFSGNDMMAVGTRFGNYGIAFNQEEMKPNAANQWDALLSSNLRGKLALFDWYLPVMGNVSLALFPDNPNPYDLTDQQLAQVRDWLLKLKPNVKLVTPNVQDIVTAFINGDVVAGPVGDWVIQNAIADGHNNLTAVVPESGAIRWSEAAAVCKQGQNKELALEWVKYMSTPEVQARLANAKAYKGIAPNPRAAEFMSAAEKQLLGYVPDKQTPGKLVVEAQLERTRPRQLPVQQSDQVWQEIYNEFKAS